MSAAATASRRYRPWSTWTATCAWEQEALAEHAAAYADVRRFHQRLKELLAEAQYQVVLEAYKASLPPLRP